MFYYAVAKGWNIGIFRTLADVKKNTEGYWGKQYR
jgi:viroplasmin and RNaseH domain-containing protein